MKILLLGAVRPQAGQPLLVMREPVRVPRRRWFG